MLLTCILQGVPSARGVDLVVFSSLLSTPLQGCVESGHGIDAPDRAQRDASASGP